MESYGKIMETIRKNKIKKPKKYTNKNQNERKTIGNFIIMGKTRRLFLHCINRKEKRMVRKRKFAFMNFLDVVLCRVVHLIFLSFFIIFLSKYFNQKIFKLNLIKINTNSTKNYQNKKSICNKKG